MKSPASSNVNAPPTSSPRDQRRRDQASSTMGPTSAALGGLENDAMASSTTAATSDQSVRSHRRPRGNVAGATSL